MLNETVTMEILGQGFPPGVKGGITLGVVLSGNFFRSVSPLSSPFLLFNNVLIKSKKVENINYVKLKFLFWN